MTVYFIATNGDGGKRVRSIWPAEALRARGWDVQAVFGWVGGLETGDVVIIHRPLAPDIVEWVTAYKQAGCRVLVQEDDDLGCIPPQNEWQATPEQIKSHDQSIREADGLIVATEPLAKIYGPLAKRTWVLRNYLPARLGHARYSHNGVVKVGWAGVLQVHTQDIAWLRPVAEELLEGATFWAVGDMAAARMLGGMNHDGVPWQSTEEDFYWQMARCDIGIVPLDLGANRKFNESKCLDSSTPVSTPGGLRRIGTVEVGDSVWNGHRFAPVQAVERQASRVGLRVTTERGWSILATPEHRLATAEGFRRVDQLVIGDSLRLSGWPLSNELRSVAWPLFHTRQSRVNPGWTGRAGGSLPRVTIDETWGELLGFFAGDGCFFSNSMRISIDGQDQDIVDRVMGLFNDIGLWASAKSRRMFDGSLLRRQEVSAASTKLGEFLVGLGMVVEGRRSGTWKRRPLVPEVIELSPEPVVAAFLRGYFEADGTVGGSAISAASKDRELLEGVRRLLLGFGIVSRLKRQIGAPTGNQPDGYVSWLLTLRREAVDIFAKRIGFVSERKNGRLRTVTSKPHSNAYRIETWMDSIISINPEPCNPVDVQLEGQVFVADGIVSHNSWLKALEFMTLGKPVVVSALPEQRKLVDHGVTGYLASTPKEFTRYVQVLVRNPTLRTAMGEQAREKAATLTIERRIEEWEAMLSEVTTGDPVVRRSRIAYAPRSGRATSDGDA